MVIRQLRQIGQLLIGFIILFGCLLAGRLLSELMGEFLPGSIVGMLLLTLLLSLGWIKFETVAPGANLLIKWLSLLFVPISVALVDRLAFIWDHGVSILVSITVSTLLVLFFAGRLWQWLERRF